MLLGMIILLGVMFLYAAMRESDLDWYWRLFVSLICGVVLAIGANVHAKGYIEDKCTEADVKVEGKVLKNVNAYVCYMK